MVNTLGIIGLGKMGGNLALNALDNKIKVVGKSLNPTPALSKKGVTVATNYDDFFKNMPRKRLIYVSLPAGKLIDTVISEMLPYLNKGDVVMDGGNSFFRDSIRREKELFKKGIYFLDCGTSGGWEGARYGACFMVGGKDAGIKVAASVLKKLAVKDGYVHTGKPGTGHFTKLVHNGIEFGMLQAIGEGVELMKHSEFNIDLQKIFKNWSNGSVIRSWLVELMEREIREQNFDKIQAYIEDTGEVSWLVQDAINKEIPIPIISGSVMELFKSRKKPEDSYRAIALMRHGFGGHPFGRSKYIQNERKTSRVEKI